MEKIEPKKKPKIAVNESRLSGTTMTETSLENDGVVSFYESGEDQDLISVTEMDEEDDRTDMTSDDYNSLDESTVLETMNSPK